MSERFADTFYFLALVNARDPAHAAAQRIARQPCRVVTTGWVLTEVADAMSAPQNRSLFLTLVAGLRVLNSVEVVPPTADLFDRGLDLYARRPDKSWSLTVCISFVVMDERKITDALTGDHHFVQAGFRALMLPDQTPAR